jgi:hypothetical protein
MDGARLVFRGGVWMENDSESLLRVVGWYSHFARLAEQREAELGHPAENCPTATDLWALVAVIAEMHSGEADHTPTEVWAFMQKLAAVSDKWVDPENDPIGADVYEVVEETISNLRIMMDKAVPEGAKDTQKWANMRELKHCIARQVYRESLNPSLPKRLWQSLFGRRTAKR